jgi:hypothetical protein
VRVLYDPSAPQQAKIDSFATLWMGSLFYLGVGAVFGIGGGVLFFATRRIAASAASPPDDSPAAQGNQP